MFWREVVVRLCSKMARRSAIRCRHASSGLGLGFRVRVRVRARVRIRVS
jgi:hypothetical protein